MKSYLISYLAVLFVLLVMDSIWMSMVAKSLYKTKVGHLMAEKPKYFVAVLFYIIYGFGLVLLVIAPFSSADDAMKIINYAALYGLCTQSTYALTNLAILKNWPASLSVIDISWGVFMTIIAAWVGSVVLGAF